MCKWALISWPVKESKPNKVYVILGEFYDKKIYDNISFLSEFYRDLQYFYPFRFSVSRKNCYNIEDIFCLQKKYGLTIRHRLVGNTKEKVLTMRTPILYDISCMVPLFPTSVQKLSYIQKNESVCIVMPCIDLIKRGKLLEEIINYGSKIFAVCGNIYGENKDTIATLSTRYLLKRGVPFSQIVKISGNKNTEYILEAIDILNIIITNYNIVIACRSDDIQDINKKLRIWRKKKMLNRKVTYICPFD